MSCLCACILGINLSSSQMNDLDKNLGNIKNSHKAIEFVGLINNMEGKLYHYVINGAGASQIAAQECKEKAERILERIMSFKLSQRKMAKEMGFDTSREVFIKGTNSVVMILELTQQYGLVVMMEMNELKVEFFDCEGYVTTIDDLVVNLLDGLNKADDEQ